MGRLDGKVVLVTGAAGAIGSAVASGRGRGRHGDRERSAGRGNVRHALDVTSESDGTA